MKRVTLFAGHYGSGKTNLAVNYARWLRRNRPADGRERPVVIADLDIVNPYFRTKDSAAELAREGISLVVSDFANSNVDFPALPKEVYSLFPDACDLTSGTTGVSSVAVSVEEGPLPDVVVDVGGDDRGALALGRYAPAIRAEGDYEMLAVVNASRPLTRTPADTVEVLREIEASSSGLRFTGVVNNTNLGPDTTAETVLGSLPYAEAVAAALGVPVRLTACPAALAPALAGKVPDLFPLDLQTLCYHLAR